LAHNQSHDIVPQALNKSIQDIMAGTVVPGKRTRAQANSEAALQTAEAVAHYTNPKAVAQRIRQVEDEMHKAAKSLAFEKAAQLRDELLALRDQLKGNAF
jgi:excinuclease ABC subunit B